MAEELDSGQRLSIFLEATARACVRTGHSFELPSGLSDAAETLWTAQFYELPLNEKMKALKRAANGEPMKGRRLSQEEMAEKQYELEEELRRAEEEEGHNSAG